MNTTVSIHETVEDTWSMFAGEQDHHTDVEEVLFDLDDHLAMDQKTPSADACKESQNGSTQLELEVAQEACEYHKEKAHHHAVKLLHHFNQFQQAKKLHEEMQPQPAPQSPDMSAELDTVTAFLSAVVNDSTIDTDESASHVDDTSDGAVAKEFLYARSYSFEDDCPEKPRARSRRRSRSRIRGRTHSKVEAHPDSPRSPVSPVRDAQIPEIVVTHHHDFQIPMIVVTEAID